MNQGATDDDRDDPILYPNEQDIQIDTLVCLMVFDLLDILTLELACISIDVDFPFDVLAFYSMKLFAFGFRHHIQQNTFRMDMVSKNMLLKQLLDE